MPLRLDLGADALPEGIEAGQKDQISTDGDQLCGSVFRDRTYRPRQMTDALTGSGQKPGQRVLERLGHRVRGQCQPGERQVFRNQFIAQNHHCSP